MLIEYTISKKLTSYKRYNIGYQLINKKEEDAKKDDA